MTETGEQEDSTECCPVCGQEYDHKREESGTRRGWKLRSDATECSTAGVGQRTAYIHIRGDVR